MPEIRANTNTIIEIATPFATATFGAGLWRHWYAFGYYFYSGQEPEPGTEKTV